MKQKKKRGIDINDHSLWGYRFELRERYNTQRRMFSFEQFNQKKPKAPRSAKERPQPKTNNNSPKVKPKLKPEPPDLRLPKAKTQANRLNATRGRKRTCIGVDAEVRALMKKMLDAVEAGLESLKQLNATYVAADLRYFNLDVIPQKFGLFDSNSYTVVVVDPPWPDVIQEPGALSPVFSNEDYCMSFQEIINLHIESLSRSGFCFLWVSNAVVNLGYDCLHKWGYDCVDHIVWVKTTALGRKALVETGRFFSHSKEMCLVGYKCAPGDKVEFRSKISNDLIIADVRDNAQKPDQLYTIIDLMMPGTKKIEIFARNHNMRDGWLSVGNQLGEPAARVPIACRVCVKEFTRGQLRYKLRRKPGVSICEECVQEYMLSRNLTEEDFYELSVGESVSHYYHTCGLCGVNPIPGVRFTCAECDMKDFCEACYDQLVASELGCGGHEFQSHAFPQSSREMVTHSGKSCYKCGQTPVLGPCFSCADCQALAFCQGCFFQMSFQGFDEIPGHDSKHRLEIVTTPVLPHKYVICVACGRSPVVGRRYKCLQCFNYNLCELCYIRRKFISIRPGIAHSQEHVFVLLSYQQKITQNEGLVFFSLASQSPSLTQTIHRLLGTSSARHQQTLHLDIFPSYKTISIYQSSHNKCLQQCYPPHKRNHNLTILYAYRFRLFLLAQCSIYLSSSYQERLFIKLILIRRFGIYFCQRPQQIHEIRYLLNLLLKFRAQYKDIPR